MYFGKKYSNRSTRKRIKMASLAIATSLILTNSIWLHQADAANIIYIDYASGSDTNSGVSPQKAVKSLSKAKELAGINGEIVDLAQKDDKSQDEKVFEALTAARMKKDAEPASAPNEVKAPEVTAAPEVLPDPELTPVPQESAVPELTPTPQPTEVPEETKKPESTDVPDHVSDETDADEDTDQMEDEKAEQDTSQIEKEKEKEDQDAAQTDKEKEEEADQDNTQIEEETNQDVTPSEEEERSPEKVEEEKHIVDSDTDDEDKSDQEKEVPDQSEKEESEKEQVVAVLKELKVTVVNASEVQKVEQAADAYEALSDKDKETVSSDLVSRLRKAQLASSNLPQGTATLGNAAGNVIVGDVDKVYDDAGQSDDKDDDASSSKKQSGTSNASGKTGSSAAKTDTTQKVKSVKTSDPSQVGTLTGMGIAAWATIGALLFHKKKMKK